VTPQTPDRSRCRLIDRARIALTLFVLTLGASFGPEARAQGTVQAVDIALVLAVDVSGSINSGRFTLQMEGIAKAFEDPEVQRAILGGRNGAMLVTLVNWSNKPILAAPWTMIASEQDARAFADRVRHAPRTAADFTCLSTMMQTVDDKVLPQLPLSAERLVVDVSGDGRDNCNPATPVDAVRDSLVASGVTINGLPILEGKEADTIAGWYEDHVIGGATAFLEPAYGYEDFARAMRQKFITEISGLARPRPPSIAGRLGP
jgi:hypothetical protein